MIEVYEKIYVGSQDDYSYSINHNEPWAVLHCCKTPFHKNYVGYEGNLASSHPDYALKRIDNKMALNIVNMPFLNDSYLPHFKDMFTKAFAFLDEYRSKGYQILIHDNQGTSRAPTIGLLYISRLGLVNYGDFDASIEKFKKIYPDYDPYNNIYLIVKALWDDFV